MGERYTVEEIEELKPLDTKDILAIAWKSEVTAKEMYQSFIEKSDDVPSNSILKELLKEENIHENKIIDMFHDFFPDEDLEDLDPKKVVFSESIDEKEIETFEDILELAKDAEKKEKEFYHMLSKMIEEISTSRLLSYLAYEENEHYEKLKRKISERDL